MFRIKNVYADGDDDNDQNDNFVPDALETAEMRDRMTNNSTTTSGGATQLPGTVSESNSTSSNNTDSNNNGTHDGIDYLVDTTSSIVAAGEAATQMRLGQELGANTGAFGQGGDAVGDSHSHGSGSSRGGRGGTGTDHAAGSVNGGVYTVVSGDYLSAIAKENGTTVAELQRLNPEITNPNQIKPGQQIILSAPAGVDTLDNVVDVAANVSRSEIDGSGSSSKPVTDELRGQVKSIGQAFLQPWTPEKIDQIATQIMKGERTLRSVEADVSRSVASGIDSASAAPATPAPTTTSTSSASETLNTQLRQIGQSYGETWDTAKVERLANEVNSGGRSLRDIEADVSRRIGAGGSASAAPATPAPATTSTTSASDLNKQIKQIGQAYGESWDAEKVSRIASQVNKGQRTLSSIDADVSRRVASSNVGGSAVGSGNDTSSLAGGMPSSGGGRLPRGIDNPGGRRR